jgi:hypothetical protein
MLLSNPRPHFIIAIIELGTNWTSIFYQTQLYQGLLASVYKDLPNR